MTPLPQREYLTLLIGDALTFIASLWVTLALRALAVPDRAYFILHMKPFAILFVAWLFVFFLAGLYTRYTRIVRVQLPQRIFYTQTLNVVIAATFFFLIPEFGIAPKTVLFIYLIISSLAIFSWRVLLFPMVRPKERSRAILIGTGAELSEISEEINSDERYPFLVDRTLDTAAAQMHEAIQQLCRVAEEDKIDIIIADATHPALAAALPIMYDAAFRKRHFLFFDTADLYESLFARVPLPLVDYSWILENLTSSHGYDVTKRIVDMVSAIVLSPIFLCLSPLVALAIKLDDGGAIFISQERIGRFQQPIKIWKFRSMSGNDNGVYGGNGATQLTVTRVGKVIRALRIDELPQLWNLFKGDLSLVGPRPELPTLAAHYSARIPFYNARHLVKPGLTGWAQLRHDRHAHHGADIAETKSKLSYDLYYLRHRSFMLDLYIMFQTGRIVLFERGS